MAIMFGVLYGLSCITKLWGNFYVLLLGRLLGGVSTSLLFSVFESWMVYEHHKVLILPLFSSLILSFFHCIFFN